MTPPRESRAHDVGDAIGYASVIGGLVVGIAFVLHFAVNWL